MNNLQSLQTKLDRMLAEKYKAIELNKTFKLPALDREIAQIQNRILNIKQQQNK